MKRFLSMKMFYLAASVLLWLPVAIQAQSAIEEEAQIPFPVVPFIAEYEYQPFYFMQWIANHPQYKNIEAALDNLDKPNSIQIVLTERETGRRIYYCSADAKAKELQAQGKEAYPAKIDFKQTAAAEQQKTYGFALRDKNGQAIRWRVIPAAAPSERGRMLVPAATAPGLLLNYFNSSTAVGEGTAIQIGEKVIAAEPWNEISVPPYFVAYRGTIANGRHSGSLLLGERKWQIVGRPAELKEGAEWILSDWSGQRRVFKITARQNNGELTISEQGANSMLMSVTVRAAESREFVMRSVRIGNNSQALQIKFEPELSFDPPNGSKSATNFTISEGKYDKIVSGTASIEKIDGDLRLQLMPKSPDWTKTRSMETIIKSASDGFTIKTSQSKQ